MATADPGGSAIGRRARLAELGGTAALDGARHPVLLAPKRSESLARSGEGSAVSPPAAPPALGSWAHGSEVPSLWDLEESNDEVQDTLLCQVKVADRGVFRVSLGRIERHIILPAGALNGGGPSYIPPACPLSQGLLGGSDRGALG